MSSRVAVTGGSGKLGRAVVQHLAENGYNVVNLDRTPTQDQPGAFVRVDLTDYGQVAAALHAVDDKYERVDAVVHLAAIPAPGLTTNAATFDNNITGTYHVFEAARAAGIRRIVWASSETVLGLPFSPENPPPYIPVDEQYHPRPNSAYSLGKTLEEEMAAQFCRWDPDAVDDGPAVLERDGTGRLRRLSRIRPQSANAAVESLGLRRRAGRRARGAAGVGGGDRPASTSSSLPPPTP